MVGKEWGRVVKHGHLLQPHCDFLPYAATVPGGPEPCGRECIGTSGGAVGVWVSSTVPSVDAVAGAVELATDPTGGGGRCRAAAVIPVAGTG